MLTGIDWNTTYDIKEIFLGATSCGRRPPMSDQEKEVRLRERGEDGPTPLDEVFN
jgi:hypothetical protein